MAEGSQWLVNAQANCENCDFHLNAKNAQGVAAQHADKYGHTVHVDLLYNYTAEPE